MTARAVAWLLGIAALAVLVVLGVAGLEAAWAVLGTAGALVAMIAMGNLLGGRTTANRAPTTYVPEMAASGVVEPVLRSEERPEARADPPLQPDGDDGATRNDGATQN